MLCKLTLFSLLILLEANQLFAQFWYLDVTTGELKSFTEWGERFAEEGLLAVAVGNALDVAEQLPHALDGYGIDYDYHEEGLVVYLNELYKAWRLMKAGEDIQATLGAVALMDLFVSIRPTQERVVGRLLRTGFGPSAIVGRSSVWELPAVQRGVEIEILRAGGHRLPHGFPVVDIYRNGIAISVKSIDLTLASYHTNRLFYRLKGYVDKLVRFKGASWGDEAVVGVFKKELEIVIPKGRATPKQWEILKKVIDYGKSHNIPVKIIEL